MKTLAISLALFCGSVQAQFLDGNKLLQVHTSDRPSAIYYVMGVHDGLSNITICSPLNITGGQITDMVMQFINTTPAIRHQGADAIVSHVLSNMWPCKKATGTSV